MMGYNLKKQGYLLISEQYNYLATSLDGLCIFEDGKEGIEIKCPYSARHFTREELIEDI